MMTLSSLGLSADIQGLSAKSPLQRDATFEDLLGQQISSAGAGCVSASFKPAAPDEALKAGNIPPIDGKEPLPLEARPCPAVLVQPTVLENSPDMTDGESPKLSASPVPSMNSEIGNSTDSRLILALGVGASTLVPVGKAGSSAKMPVPAFVPSSSRDGDEAPEKTEPTSTPAQVELPAPVLALSALLTSPRSNSLPEKSDGTPLVRSKGSASAAALLTMSKNMTEPQSVGVATSAVEQGQKLSMDTALNAMPFSFENSKHTLATNGGATALGQARQAPLPVHASASDLDGSHIDLLLKDISELTSSAGKASFQLSSEHLGRLQVRLESSEVGLSVAIKTDSERGHVAVSHSQDQLRDELHTNGLRVSETSVALSHNGADRERHGHGASSRFAAPIEAALESRAETDPTQSDRPDGRFA